MQPPPAAPVESSVTCGRTGRSSTSGSPTRSSSDAPRTATSLRSTALCERHAPRVERIALHVLRDPEDARDAAQESLAKLVQRIGQFRGESQFSTWLHRLVVNTCKDVAQARWAARRTEPLVEDLRVARDGDPVARARRARRRAASSAAASPSCRRRRRPSSR